VSSYRPLAVYPTGPIIRSPGKRPAGDTPRIPDNLEGMITARLASACLPIDLPCHQQGPQVAWEVLRDGGADDRPSRAGQLNNGCLTIM